MNIKWVQKITENISLCKLYEQILYFLIFCYKMLRVSLLFRSVEWFHCCQYNSRFFKSRLHRKQTLRDDNGSDCGRFRAVSFTCNNSFLAAFVYCESLTPVSSLCLFLSRSFSQVMYLQEFTTSSKHYSPFLC